MSTLIVSLGWRGFGFSTGLLPELRLGPLSVSWCKGCLLESFRGWNSALLKAREELTPK